MSNKMTVHMNEKPVYDIIIEQSFDQLTDEIKKLDVSQKKLCIVTDTTVADYYLREVKAVLTNCCPQVISFVFPAGEASKNLDTVSLLYKTLIDHHFERTDMLVALGGGVVGDLCGFGAATFLRGISFIQIPTTLLSQVDSSIGGKTGVDYSSYKNMVGAFHMPSLVYINTSTLLTLTNEQFASGMGEIIKHGLIKDNSYYHWLKDNVEQIKARDIVICEQMIIGSNQIKRLVVEHDPMEKGERALLNFGHTYGHAIEKLKNFQLLHGHCVAIGCLGAAYLSYQRKQISLEQLEDLQQLLIQFDLPVSIEGLISEEVLQVTKLDKKMARGAIKFILLEALGSAVIKDDVSESEMLAGISYILA